MKPKENLKLIDPVLTEYQRVFSSTYSQESIDTKIESLDFKRRSIVMKVNSCFRSGKRVKMWIKIPKAKENAEAEFKTLEDLYKKFASVKGFSVVKPAFFIPRSRGIVTEDFEGRNLQGLIKKNGSILNFRFKADKTLSDYLYRCGEWLSIFQKVTQRDHYLKGEDLAILQSQSIKDDFSALRSMGAKENLLIEVEEYIQEHLDKIKRISCETVLHHANLGPWNALVGSDGEIVILDFEGASLGWPVQNLALFIIHLGALQINPFFKASELKQLKLSFLKGYKENTDFVISSEILDFFEARYMAYVIARDRNLFAERNKILKSIIIKRTVKYFENWFNQRIIQGM